jgi:flagellar motor switch protein FliM
MPHHRDPGSSTQHAAHGATIPKRAVKRRRTVRRIPLKSLEALSRAEVELGNRLLGLLPSPHPGERLLDELADELERLVGLAHDVFFHTVRTYEGNEFTSRLEDHFVTTLRLAPDPDEIVVAADMNLVASWIEELLDDEPPEARTLTPPSARDFGLVTFVAMQLVNWLCGRGLPPLSMPTAQPDLDTVAQRLRRQSEIAELVYTVTSRRAAGLVRLFVPADMVRSMEVFVATAARHERRRHRLMMTRLGTVPVELSASLGGVRLAAHELGSLGQGDVLLPGEHGLRDDALTEGAVAGKETVAGKEPRGKLWLGASQQSFLWCEFRRQSTDMWEVEITDATPRDRSPNITEGKGDTVSHEEKQESQNSHGHATQVLEKAEVDVEVRVGTLPLPVAMLAEVQSGYVLELERRVDDGVDLVVDGRLVGRGELVNVDGRLGVRVLSIED